MLVPREEARFDFRGAKFDLKREGERALLGWVFNQFLYGEVTGIQCGHWLYWAPHLNAAAFLAKQAGEELAHVRKMLRILSILGEKPSSPHWAIKFLSTGQMGYLWGEHVAVEMALGEGLVLGVFYAMLDTVPQPEIQKILELAIADEERHVEFGERETALWLQGHPSTRKLLLGSALLQRLALRHVKKFVLKKLMRNFPTDHPVLAQFGEFYDFVLKTFSKRIERLELSGKPLENLSRLERIGLVASLPLRKTWTRFTLKKPLLTSTYLGDPVLLAEQRRFHSSSSTT